VKVVLDTDIGNDIDDAVCLDYLLRNRACRLLGVMTVTAGAADRGRLASALCLRHGRPDVPVVVGAERPLTRQPLQEPPFSGVGAWPHAEPRIEPEFLSRVIRQHPGEVTLLAIGALTNVAELIQADPEAARMVRSLVLMGGRYFTPGAEWNIRNDPEAAEIVFGFGFRHLRAIGLDVTRQVSMSAEAFRGTVSGPLLDFAAPWLERRDTVHFHDPLAAVTLFKPVCGYAQGWVEMSNEDTLFTPDAAGLHEVAHTVDAQATFQELAEPAAP
jgi:purine nucleosidase